MRFWLFPHIFLKRTQCCVFHFQTPRIFYIFFSKFPTDSPTNQSQEMVLNHSSTFQRIHAALIGIFVVREATVKWAETGKSTVYASRGSKDPDATTSLICAPAFARIMPRARSRMAASTSASAPSATKADFATVRKLHQFFLLTTKMCNDF